MELPVGGMSLVAQFDDICRRISVLLSQGCEDEFIAFVKNQEECRKRWLAAENKTHYYQSLYQKTVAEKDTIEANLVYARTTIQTEINKRMKVEQERATLEQQISLIRELLLNDNTHLNDQTREKLAFLNSTMPHDSPRRLETIDESSHSVLSSPDVSYDRTDENIEPGFARTKRSTRSGEGRLSDELKRRQVHKDMTPPKKLKVSGNDSLIATTVVEFPREGAITATSTIETRSKHNNRADPAFILTNEPVQTTRQPHVLAEVGTYAKENRTPKTPNNWVPMSQYSSAIKLHNRPHDFVTKTVYKPEPCMPCGKKIAFGKSAFKCKDCRTVCHIDCKEQAPLPCVPVVNTPTSKGVMGSIADYTPRSRPMVPGIVIHCVNEVEARGLSEVGIYRVPGSEREVKELKEKFLRGRGIPNLSRLDIHCVCGCLKDFLRSLKEPLIPTTLWNNFVRAAEPSNEDSLTGMYQAISELPLPNRDTLAFLILHLQRVSETPECRMNASNLARIFGPTVVGYSSQEPEPVHMLVETKKQAAVMERLLSITDEYWSAFVNVECDDSAGFVTPDALENPGRRTASLNKGKMIQTPLGPRESARKTRINRRSTNFFTSPMLK